MNIETPIHRNSLVHLQGRITYVFDMDNTLVMTDCANNSAYRDAVKSVVGMNVEFDKSRITRTNLQRIFPWLTALQINAIVKLKECKYAEYVKETKLNTRLFKLLKVLNGNGCHTILLTESRADRAMQICNYYSITPYFTKLFFKEDFENTNKYSFLKQSQIPLDSVVLFENEPWEAQKAIQNGLRKDHVIKIQ